MQQGMGDQMMTRPKVDVPSIKSLMASVLSKCIHFSANDCGYAGTRHGLIASWVHPLFLKAKTLSTQE